MINTKKRSVIIFVILALLSIVLISGFDRIAYILFGAFSSSLAIVADLRLTSLIVVIGIYFYVNKFAVADSSQQESDKIKRALRLAAIWIVATIYFVLIKKVWVPSLANWIDYIAFMVTGLLAEEFLFRGVLYQLGVKLFGTKTVAGFSIPVWITSLLFGLQHLGYHHFQVNPSSITQVIYTTIMGLFFCNLREATGYLWPAILLHLLTNSFTLIRNLGWV